MGASLSAGVPETNFPVPVPSQFETVPETKQRSRRGLFTSTSHPKNHLGDKKLGKGGYEDKYPPDVYGEELGPDARIYKVYLDEATKFDNETVDGWREHLDVLLVFAGLFSAVVTTFVGVSTSKLDIDWSETNAHLLVESNAIQRALAAGISLNDVPVSTMSPSTEFVPKSNDHWVNVLWFASLSLSLATALFATLVKQWLKHYQSSVTGSSRDRARIIQSRRHSLEVFEVPTIVGLLPILLHVSLFMFLAGLAFFLHPLDPTCFLTVIAMSGISLGVYVVTTLFPLLNPLCPYVTPLTEFAFAIKQTPRMLFHLSKLFFIAMKLDSILASKSPASKAVLDKTRSNFLVHTIKLSHEEKRLVNRSPDSLDLNLLSWLHLIASAVPTVTSLLIQAIAGASMECGELQSKILLIGAPIFQSCPIETEPWGMTMEHPDPENCDPRNLYQKKDEITVERYIRASVQFYAHCYNLYLVTQLNARKLSPCHIEWRQGSLLFSLPCIRDAWRGMHDRAGGCEYIRTVCATPWNELPLPRVNKHGVLRFVLIFTAFLRLQASNTDGIKLLPVLWEQLLVYVAEYLRLLLYHRNNNTPGLVYNLSPEEEAFIRQSGKEIFCRMLRNKGDLPTTTPTFSFKLRVGNPDMRNINEPTKPGTMVRMEPDSDTSEKMKEDFMLLYSQFVQGLIGMTGKFMPMTPEQKTSDTTRQPTTLFELPRRHYLLRFLFLSMMLGDTESLLEKWRQALMFHLYGSTSLDFTYDFPDRYLISLVRLLDDTPLAEVENDNYAVELVSEIMSCAAHIKSFFMRLSPVKEKYLGVGQTKDTTNQFDGDYAKAGYLSAHSWWRGHRPASYITAIRYAFDKIDSLISDDGDNSAPNHRVRNILVAALADCDRCLRIADPHGQEHTRRGLPVDKLVEYMLLIPTLDHRGTISISSIWNENPIFDLLWRSLRSKHASFSEEFVDSNSMTEIIDKFIMAKGQTSWSDEEFGCYALPVAVVLLGFIQGFLKRRGPPSVLTQLSSPPTLSTLGAILFPVFHSHPSYRIETNCKPVEYNYNVLWDTLIALTKKAVPLFKSQWENILQSEVKLVNTEFKSDYERVEELKSLLGLEDNPQYTQFIVMGKDDIPTDLKGKERELKPPQEDRVEIDFCLIKSHLDDNMKLSSVESTRDSKASSVVEAETLAKGTSEDSGFDAVARLAVNVVAKRWRRKATSHEATSHELSQVV